MSGVVQFVVFALCIVSGCAKSTYREMEDPPLSQTVLRPSGLGSEVDRERGLTFIENLARNILSVAKNLPIVDRPPFVDALVENLREFIDSLQEFESEQIENSINAQELPDVAGPKSMAGGLNSKRLQNLLQKLEEAEDAAQDTENETPDNAMGPLAEALESLRNPTENIMQLVEQLQDLENEAEEEEQEPTDAPSTEAPETAEEEEQQSAEVPSTEAPETPEEEEAQSVEATEAPETEEEAAEEAALARGLRMLLLKLDRRN